VSTAFLLSEFDSRILGDGTINRRMAAELTINVGVAIPELREWEAETRPGWRIDWRISEAHDGTTVIRVPAGFVYDGASISPILQTFMGPRELYEIAAAVHDYLYRMGAPRAAADRVFRIIASSGEKHVNPARAWLGWAGVRVGGWVPYGKHARRRAR